MNRPNPALLLPATVLAALLGCVLVGCQPELPPPAEVTAIPDGDGDGVGVDQDCNDDDPTIYPGAPERCDGLDNDCDGAPGWDEADLDGDGYAICAGDCSDGVAAVHPLAPEVCNGADDNCNGSIDEIFDDDHDGFTTCGNDGELGTPDDDCDDHDASLNLADADGDGYTTCRGDCDDTDASLNPYDLDGDEQDTCSGDCDDLDPTVFTGAAELCDRTDNDCDGALPADELDTDGDGHTPCEGDCDDTDASLNLDDADGDLASSCGDQAVEPDCDDTDAALNQQDADGDGWSTCAGDCNDHNPIRNLDDLDGDGQHTCAGDCDDNDPTLNTLDADLDGTTSCDGDCDDDCAELNLNDVDGDGYDTCGSQAAPDCDDADAAIHPDAFEDCGDGVDNDCDNSVDENDLECGGSTFMVVCDARGNDNGINEAIVLEMVDEALTQGADFFVASGDMVNGTPDEVTFESQLTSWVDAMSPLYNAGIGVFPVRGNHEDHSVDAWNNVFSGQYQNPLNGPPGEENLTYAVEYPGVLLLSMDEYVNRARVNVGWMAEQLAASDATHIFVQGHEPAFKAFHSDCLDDNPSSRDAMWSAMAAAGGGTYFAGHDHFFNMARVDDGDGDPDNDMFQAIVGTGGAPFYYWSGNYDGDNGAWAPLNLYHSGEYGYLMVSVAGNQASYTYWERDPVTEIYNPVYGPYVHQSVDGREAEWLSLRQGVDGYAGAIDTFLEEDDPAADNSGQWILIVGTMEPGVTQALLRYDGLFGNGVGQVPTDATVLWAALELGVTTYGDGASVHRMVMDWQGTDSWDTFGNDGVQADGVEAEAVADVVTRRVQYGATYVDVTASLQAWLADPDPEAANRGWVFLPDGPGGWQFDSSDGAEAPVLMVTYEVP